MQTVSGLVLVFEIALGAVLAVRLLRLGARTRGPEWWLGVYFLCMWCLTTSLASAVYMSWSDPRLALPDSVRRPLHGLDLALGSVGLFGIAVFTQRVFRPASAVARAALRAGGVALALAWVANGWADGFAVGVVNGPAYWIGFALRQAAITWLAVESFLYWSQARRRLAMGLADPVVVNRFLLWGVFAATVSLMQLSDPISRIWYWAVTGDAVNFHPDVGKPMIRLTLLATSTLGTIAGTTLLLAFFPTAAYRRWLVARRSA